MNDKIHFKAVYKDLDKQEARKKLRENIIIWSLGIVLFVIVLGMLLGHIDTVNTCGEIWCWDPRN